MTCEIFADNFKLTVKAKDISFSQPITIQVLRKTKCATYKSFTQVLGKAPIPWISHHCDACLILFSGSLHFMWLDADGIYEKTLYCHNLQPNCTIYIQGIHKQKKRHTGISQSKDSIPQRLSLKPRVSNPTLHQWPHTKSSKSKAQMA